MITHTVRQGTDDWHALRANHFTASEAPAMAGVSKYQSRAELLKQKYTGEIPEVTPAQQRLFDKGHAAEAAARTLAEEIIGEELYPITGTSEEHPHLLASLDGCTMLEDVIWEHKLLNEDLAAAVRAEELPEHYLVQMDQQLLVSGADKCLFMCSDGTRENAAWCWHYPDEARFNRLLAGWQQFRQDLADYQPQAQQVAAQGEAPEALPAIKIDLAGMVKASNLPQFKAQAMAMIEGIRTELTTDQHFADAAETVKFLQKGEKQLEASKQAALEQTASIAELFSTIDELRETMRQKRLQLDKLVKAEKENRRLEIQQKAVKTFDEWLVGLDTPVPINDTFDVAGAMKGKKTIDTLQAAADDEVARAKVAATQEAHRLADNKALIEKHQGDYAFLFSDWRDLIQRDAEFIKLQVENRIAHHKQEEQKKLDAERERIRQEEEAKAKAEADRKAAEKSREEAPPAHVGVDPGAGDDRAVRQPIDTSRITQAASNFQRGSEVAKPETVEISRKEYEALLAAREKLDALEAAGVDNWSGYDDAMAQLRAA
ncbi:YqaJ viral recombinase family protein [Halomonas sp. SSL-5]|uniref:lambda-exonuclease family protein n=1 Tax=Halomonas sp. SSL-5 TaxID=3065855 RepID=UPI002739ED80|nr:YqaJ viral recombinase family protein [Halomonas sp. SSL-5]MDY7116559.1 YqaJ viral recombinase family protein [Halomonas sp. SSL-5]